MDRIIDIAVAFWAVLAEMAPWLVFGFVAAGFLSVVFKPAWIERHLGGRGFWPVFKASVLGVPLPLCSCGVIPVSTSLHKHGASKGSTASFLLSTPETGVDSIFATYALMGPVYAVARPVVALVNGVFAGWWIDRWVDEQGKDDEVEVDGAAPESGILPRPLPGGGEEEAGTSSCCSTASDTKPASLLDKSKAALRYGLITLPADLVYSLLVGLLLAALLTSLVSEAALASWLGHPWFGLLAAAVVGTPIYVCSTGSIPIAVALLHLGASPGAALVFLIAGPATNAATITVVGGLLGKRSLLVYLSSMLIVALAAGYGLNALMAYTGTAMLPESVEHMHEHGLTWWDHTWAGVMVLLLAVGLARRTGWWPSRSADAILQAPLGDEAMTDDTTTELPVEGMTCSHCAGTVERALREVAGVQEVAVDLPGKRAVVRGANVSSGALAEAVRGAGFSVPG